MAEGRDEVAFGAAFCFVAASEVPFGIDLVFVFFGDDGLLLDTLIGFFGDVGFCGWTFLSECGSSGSKGEPLSTLPRSSTVSGIAIFSALFWPVVFFSGLGAVSAFLTSESFEVGLCVSLRGKDSTVGFGASETTWSTGIPASSSFTPARGLTLCAAS